MEEKILEWYENKNVNPYTKRKIKENGVTYKKLMKLYNKFILENKDSPNKKIKLMENEVDKLSPLDSIEDIDIISLNKIWEIVDGKKVLVHENENNLITYQDENKNIHCFEKKSIQYLKDYNMEFHPITKVRIPKNILDSVNIIIPKKEKTNKDLALEIVQLLTHNSFFIDTKHIIELSNGSIDKLYYECFSFFKSNIPPNKINQIQSNNDIFKVHCIHFPNMLNKMNYLLNSFLKLLEYNDDMIKIMACHIIIGGLSIVNKDIKNLYPDYNFTFN
tara:strand:+ start:11339 stop:12166 length:828 start_codon:yes stop_codon:yes gene_type:complete